MHTHTHMHTHTYTHIHTHTRTHTHIHTNTHTHAHIHTQTHARTNTHTNTYTHACPSPLQPEDVALAADHVGFPAVIKPVSGAASIGVMRVDDVKQLEAAYTRCERSGVGVSVGGWVGEWVQACLWQRRLRVSQGRVG